MNRKLQKSWVLSSMLLLGMNATLPVVHTVFAETTPETQQVEAEELTSPYDNLLEAPADSAEENPQPMEEAPTFSFEHKEMRGTVGKTTEVVIQVDRGIEQVQVTIPEAVIVQLEEFPDGMEASQITETQWWLSAKEQTTFILPLTSETAGSYTIVVEDEVEGSVVFEEPLVEPETEEPTIDSGTSEEEDFVEDTATPEVQEDEESNEQEAEEITPATTSNVSTWAQFRTAINTSSVTVINVLADISGTTSLNNITRSLTINGNDYTVNIGSRQFVTSGNGLNITVRNIRINSTVGNGLFLTTAASRNTRFTFSDIHTNASLFMNTTNSGSNHDNNKSITFDGGVSSGIEIQSRVNMLVTNGAIVNLKGPQFYRGLNNELNNLTIDENSELYVDGRLTNMSSILVKGKLTVINELSGGTLAAILMERGSRSIIVEETGEMYLRTRSNLGVINGPLLNLTFKKKSSFNLVNLLAYGPVINLSSNIDVNIDTSNLAVWNKGKVDVENSNPSQNFENLEAQLTGANASTITETNHNVFRSTYSKQGLAGYSRISSSGIAGEGPVDPLAPDTGINPDNPPVIPENQGEFRIDFASQFIFGEQERKIFEEATYYASSQLGRDTNEELIESDPKPNYVQITDNRPEADSWELSVRQSEQFKTGQGRELAGARLQLKNRQIVADHDGAQPRETSSDEIITLEPGEKQPLLTSANGEGKGTWIYRFGDGTSSDQSVVLVVPKETIPEIATYRTQLIWELSAVPINE